MFMCVSSPRTIMLMSLWMKMNEFQAISSSQVSNRDQSMWKAPIASSQSRYNQKNKIGTKFKFNTHDKGRKEGK
jgi:hypothetical protein